MSVGVDWPGAFFLPCFNCLRKDIPKLSWSCTRQAPYPNYNCCSSVYWVIILLTMTSYFADQTVWSNLFNAWVSTNSFSLSLSKRQIEMFFSIKIFTFRKFPTQISPELFAFCPPFYPVHGVDLNILTTYGDPSKDTLKIFQCWIDLTKPIQRCL